jgi:hypothetical protein
VLLRVKAVPGASRDRIAGVLGDRLKVRVAAPPEAGRANEAIRRIFAKALGVRVACVTVESGETSAAKTLRLAGMTIERARAALLQPDPHGSRRAEGG